MAKSFQGYTHLEEKVEAIQLLPESQETIIKAFSEPAARLELARLDLVYQAADQCYTLYFRYNFQSVDSTLSIGDYLVRLNDGILAAYTEDEFNAQYINTSIDPLVPAANIQTMEEALRTYIADHFPGGSDVGELTPALLEQVANGTVGWYDAAEDVYTFDFSDCGIVSPAGLSTIIDAFMTAAFIKDTTTYKINLANGLGENSFNKPNYLNKIGLQELVGEFRKLPATMAARLVGLDFLGLNGAKSAITPSVSDAEFVDFCGDITTLTGITSSRNIRR